MSSYCARCGRESASLSAGPDGGMYCSDCAVQVSPQNMDCRSCAQRYCGGILACPFCTGCAGRESAEDFMAAARKPHVQPIRMDERCQRCGATLSGRAFILHGRALCRDCLVYEQDRWEIVPSGPDKHGSRVRVVVELPNRPQGGAGSPGDARAEKRIDDEARKLFHSIGIDPDDPPPDPFGRAGTLREGRMADDSCRNCEAYAAAGKLAKPRSAAPASGGGKRRKASGPKATHLNSKGE